MDAGRVVRGRSWKIACGCLIVLVLGVCAWSWTGWKATRLSRCSDCGSVKFEVSRMFGWWSAEEVTASGVHEAFFDGSHEHAWEMESSRAHGGAFVHRRMRLNWFVLTMEADPEFLEIVRRRVAAGELSSAQVRALCELPRYPSESDLADESVMGRIRLAQSILAGSGRMASRGDWPAPEK
ncbi:MAG: hypothetical protein HUU06_11005 [Planctomycetaceae bacterium]|nr:hypothetical protein [Planctomycetaceae bacterium]